MKKILLLLLCPALMLACSKGKVFEQYTDIPNNKWSLDNVVTFEVNIDDVSAPYDIDLAIRHSSYYAFANIRINLTIVYPSGEVRTKDHDLMIRNSDGSFKSEGAGDLWDITFPMFSGISLTEKGKYVFKVQNIMPYPITDDIMQVGLVVTKSKK